MGSRHVVIVEGSVRGARMTRLAIHFAVYTLQEVIASAASDDHEFPRFQRGYFAASAVVLVVDEDLGPGSLGQ